MPNMKHTLWTPAFTLTGAGVGATVVRLTAMTSAARAKAAPEPLVAKPLIYPGKSTGRTRGREGEHLTDHLAGGVTGDSAVTRVPVGGPSCQMVWQRPDRVDTEGHEPCTSI